MFVQTSLLVVLAMAGIVASYDYVNVPADGHLTYHHPPLAKSSPNPPPKDAVRDDAQPHLRTLQSWLNKYFDREHNTYPAVHAPRPTYVFEYDPHKHTAIDHHHHHAPAVYPTYADNYYHTRPDYVDGHYHTRPDYHYHDHRPSYPYRPSYGYQERYPVGDRDDRYGYRPSGLFPYDEYNGFDGQTPWPYGPWSKRRLAANDARPLDKAAVAVF